MISLREWSAFLCGAVTWGVFRWIWHTLGRKIGHKQLSDKDFQRGLDAIFKGQASITTPSEEEAIRECRRTKV